MKSIKELPEAERPYEKYAERGAQALNNAELLAIILRSGSRERNAVETARLILDRASVHGGLSGLYNLGAEELMAIPGIGKVKAIQLLCIAELSKRMARETIPPRPLMNRPDVIASYFMEELCHREQEELHLVTLDTRNRFQKAIVLTRGTVNSSLISPREIFVEALRQRAVHIVLLHNHPSGDVQPSPEDIRVTEQISEAGRLIGIPLLDHIIIGDHSYWSMKERGILHG